MLKIENISSYGNRVVTTEFIKNGELIYEFNNKSVVSVPNYKTIQIAADRHVEGLGTLENLNHSCKPTTTVDTKRMAIFAARAINANEELTFFYPSTEWEMARPFICLCGAPECIKIVAGAKFLSVAILRNYFINDHIKDLISISLENA